MGQDAAISNPTALPSAVKGGVEAALSGAEKPSIRQFVTDGAIARLCDEMARLTGVPIWLRDPDGLVIAPAESAGGVGGALWRSLDARAGAQRAYEIVGRPWRDGEDLFIAPLTSSIGPLGSIVMPADWAGDDPQARRALERALTILASTAVESCEGAIAIQRRVHELDALFRLSSMLTHARDPDRVLTTVLDVALETLRCDAGSIAVLDEATGDLQHRFTRNLSPQWLAAKTPLSIDGMLRERALAGDVVCVEDLGSDPRIADHERPHTEGLAGLITTGLIYAGRAAGQIRLYTRGPRVFTESERGLLRALADHAAMTLAHARLRVLREQDQQMQRQLRVAADVQRRMLPRAMPHAPRFDIAAKYAPSYQLGGDFYDIFEQRGKLGVVVGDVSGKGVPAALLMSAIRATLRAYVSDDRPLDQVIGGVNWATSRDTLESEFVTIWCGLIDPATLEVQYCAAGHDPALVFTPDGKVEELGVGGMAVGIDPLHSYPLGTHRLRAGDVLAAYTDGLPDARSFDEQRFGKQRVKETILQLLRAEPRASAQRIVEHVSWTLRQFVGIRLAVDDVTLVVVRVK